MGSFRKAESNFQGQDDAVPWQQNISLAWLSGAVHLMRSVIFSLELQTRIWQTARARSYCW